MPIRVKDHSKCNEWERRRRDRLNDAFKNLAQLLPHYDPARIPAKIDILEKSTEFVKELRLSNSRLLSNQVETDEKCKLIKQLQDEVNRLILRVKQLTILLKKASITIPIGPEIKSLGSKRMKWSGKLKPEDVENTAISDGTTTSSKEGVPAAGKVPTIISGAAQNQTSNITSQPSNDIITNSSAINTSVASIIVPLKETNLSNANGCDNANSKTCTTSISPIVITSSPVSTSEPTRVTITSVMTTCSSQSSPIKMITTSKPIFTTATSTPIQLPLQTFIIAPCPITGSTQALPSQNPQIVTRIANILSTPIVPKTMDGLPCFKVPIKSLLKPIPKVIRRRKRKKKSETLTLPPSKSKTTPTIKIGTQEVQPDKDKIAKDDANSNENVSSTATKLIFSPTDKKDNEKLEPQGQTQTASAILETNNENDNAGKTDEKDSSKDTVENELPVPETSLITNNEISPELSTSVTASSIVAKEPQETKVIDLSEDVEVVVEQIGSCSEKTAIVSEGSKITDCVSEKQDKIEKKRADKETQECDNIPVLRIIEASDEGGGVHDNIMSTVVVENSNTETLAEKEVLDHDMTQSKVIEEKEIDKESLEISPERNLMEEASKISSNSDKAEINAEPSSITRAGNESDKFVSEIPTEKPAKNSESCMDTQNEDNMESVTAPDLCKENINNQKDIDNLGNSLTDISHRKDAAVVQDQSCTTHTPAQAECHNLGSICNVPNSYSAANTSIAPTKENEVPSSSKEISATISQKHTELQPLQLEPLTPEKLPEKGLHDVTPVTPSTSLSKQREESEKVKATSAQKAIIDNTETVTTDKISECIARSIDLIDANDSELMALGEHWEDSGASPKSISPTQIFLNIFPLLPRESSINEQHHSQTTHQLTQNSLPSTFQPASKNILPFTPSSNSRSSFFIDAMLPDDHPPSTTSTEITDPINTSLPSSHSPFLPLTPPQYSSLAPTSQQISSPFSLSSNYYWTPQTVPSSTHADTNFMDYRNTSNINIFSLDDNQRSCVSSSTIVSSLATTTTLTPVVASVKSSTVPAVSTTLSVTAPILSTAASKTKTKNSENHTTRSNKRQKTESSGKVAFMVDTSLPTFPKDKKTKTLVPTSTSTNFTWTGASTSTTSSTLHVPIFQQNAAQNVPTVPAMDSMGHCSSTPASSSSQKIPYHSCSLLDALNPMDASFFRPLINALDSHDFRSIDLPGGNSLPPPPLPPLITPSSTTSLYSSHINPAPQPAQNSPMNTTSYSSHHQHPLIQPNQPIQMFSSNVPLASSSRCHSEISNHGTKHQHHNKPMQEYQSVTVSSQQESRPSPSSKANKYQSSNVPSSGTEKTSRTSARPKHESKQGRSGKSSRTQPYVTPSSASQTATDQKQSQKQDHNAPNDTPKATRTHSFHTIHSHIHPSTDLSSSSSRNYDFHSIQSQSSNKISQPVKAKPANSDKAAPTPRTQVPKPSESKTQKIKEQKAQTSHSSNNSKQTSRSSQPQHNSFSIAQQIPSHSQTSTSVSLKSTSSQPSAKVISANQPTLPHQTNFSRPNLNEIPKPLQIIQNTTSSISQPIPQLPQSSGESISLFPEFSTIGTNCNTSRQFAGGQSHAPPQYYHHDTSSMQQQQEQPPSTSNFPIQRTQPYYFPDISSFETFPAVHQNQGQPQHPLVTQQLHHPPISRQAVSESSNNYVQNQSQSESHEPVSHTTKCTYGSNPSTASNANSNQPEFQHAHVQHQSTMRQHQNYFMHQDAYHHHNQQPPTQHHATTLVQQSESQRHQPQFPTCQQQVQQQPSRNHAHHPHSNTSTATTSTTTSVSSGKEKQQHSTPAAPALPFHPRATSQPQQTPHQHQVSNNLQQNLPQPTNRTSSKTVNWMTDTGYRSNSSASAVANKQQRQNTGTLASTSNPFSVSKLVGNTSGAVAVPSKVQQAPSSRNVSGIANSSKTPQHQAIASHNINASTHTTTTRQNKSSRNNTSSNSSTAGTGTTPTHSQNQSNYCAEALIRKNPPVAAATNDWMNDFNLVSSTNQNFHAPSYPDGHSHNHSSSHSHTQHHQTQNTATENFSGSYTSNICGGTYHYQAGAASSTASSNASHFPHFDQVQPQYNMTHHRNQHHHQPQHTVQTSTSSNYDHGQQRVHNSPSHSSQPHDMQINATSQMHYQHQHHHHHQIHLSNQHPQTHSSSSSVTNFNLSTIFPEINDKRSTNNSGNSLGAQVQGGSTSSGNNNNSNAGGSGNINPAFGYQHSNFGSSTEGPGHLR